MECGLSSVCLRGVGWVVGCEVMVLVFLYSFCGFKFMLKNFKVYDRYYCFWVIVSISQRVKDVDILFRFF